LPIIDVAATGIGCAVQIYVNPYSPTTRIDRPAPCVRSDCRGRSGLVVLLVNVAIGLVRQQRGRDDADDGAKENV
jgi:hypothetical protein